GDGKRGVGRELRARLASGLLFQAREDPAQLGVGGPAGAERIVAAGRSPGEKEPKRGGQQKREGSPTEENGPVCQRLRRGRQGRGDERIGWQGRDARGERGRRRGVGVEVRSFPSRGIFGGRGGGRLRGRDAGRDL